MSRMADDIKAGIKGVRGAGDVIRGSAMEVADQVFERDPYHPTAVAKQEKNRALTEQGKADIRGLDESIARREWERKHHLERHAGAVPVAPTDGRPITTAGEPRVEPSTAYETVPTTSVSGNETMQSTPRESRPAAVVEERHAVPSTAYEKTPTTVAGERQAVPSTGSIERNVVPQRPIEDVGQNTRTHATEYPQHTSTFASDPTARPTEEFRQPQQFGSSTEDRRAPAEYGNRDPRFGVAPGQPESQDFARDRVTYPHAEAVAQNERVRR